MTRLLLQRASLLVHLALTFSAFAADRLRPPAVPLVTHDPYFSIWSPADKLTDADTMHWTGKPHRLTSLVRIDGKGFRIMGASPTNVPALPQTGLEVTPTRTIYTFEGEGVRLTLTFMTPALPDDLEVLSRPVTYVTCDFRATDDKTHEAQAYVDASAEIVVNEPHRQHVVWSADIYEKNHGAFLSVGSKEQPILAKKGDDLRIDWGHCYLAFPDVGATYCGVGGRIFNQVIAFKRGMTSDRDQPAAADEIAAYVEFHTFKVSSQPVSRWLMLAYDDEYSIKYFRQNLRPYWRRNGDDAAALLKKAAADYESLKQRCEKFDAGLMADLRQIGGENYAQLCALAYRQTLAGNKIVADANGQPLMFPKENFSNGCIGTVDVLFPQAPFFLVFSPALTKAMLVPILDYAASPRWPYGYAPHDLGTYPHATGQVYGMGGGDGQRMPVEESGNMLIMLTALAKHEGNTDLTKKYWPMLKTWADYLVTDGLDPTNQLCSADMFGHLPRNANLALKAIIGIGGFAQLCELAGKPDDAKKYLGIARDYAAKWQELSKDDGHTRLAYHMAGTWAMKHNLIWDRVLGLNLFPPYVGDAEIAWYLKVQKKYGLPVDNRTDTSLIDWALWSIAPARNDADFQALLEPIWRYANETPSRVPLSDWFVTTSARMKGFQARPVVGGIFIKMVTDVPTWNKWAKLGANTSGPWAPIPTGGVAREVVPTAKTVQVTWRYTLEKPADDWIKPGFDDSAWKEGQGGFGTKGTRGAIIGTEWKTKQIWLRREFALPDRVLKNPRLLLIYDEDPEIYLNGVAAAKLTGWTTSYDEADIAPAALATLKPGKNVMAVRASQTYGGQCIDVGMGEDGEPGKAGIAPAQLTPPKSAQNNRLPGLRKIMDTPLRDTSICRGPDGTWYLTGTVEPFWAYNEGIKVWKSPDLTNWTALGFVWKYGASPWHKPYLEKKKPLWAPEIHFLKGTFWLTYSIPGWDGTDKTSGSGLLKSTSGKPEGPYEDVHPGERLGDEIDASLFQDDDGTVYFLWHSGKIARMKPDMSGLAEPYRWLKTTVLDPNPKHHSGLCAGIFGKGSSDHVGYEGMFLFKANGRYHLSCAENFEGRYSCTIATATNLFGPYSERYEAIPHGGHNMFYKDEKGEWWSSYFGSDGSAPWRERAGVLPVGFGPDGRVQMREVKASLRVRKLLDFPVRDTSICVGPGRAYYLTGTTGHPTWWTNNEGIRIWRSPDLTNWVPLGLVWTFEKDATWQKPVKDGHRAIWAPEIHYLKGTFWLAYCINWRGGGTGLLKSASGKAEGPYVDVKPDGPITSEIDASLFQDDDGKVYFVFQNGKIAKMNDDLTGLTEPPRLLKPANFKQVGFEGAFLTKINGRYLLVCAEFNRRDGINAYDCMVASADNIFGPYGDRYLALPTAGHNMLFKDTQGRWWATYFGNDPQAPWRERLGILPVRLDESGRIAPE